MLFLLHCTFLVSVFVLNDGDDVDGDSDAGVALFNAFNYVSSNKEPYDALAFMTDVFSRIEHDEELQVETVRRPSRANTDLFYKFQAL